MKKRIPSLLAFLLLFSLLLCSCAEGLPFSELTFVAKEKTTAFSSRVENLLADNMPLAANGETDFAVVFDKTASGEVQQAIADFCAQFKAYSGADLTENSVKTAKGRIMIGVADSDAAKEVLKELSAATFYIGFAGKDLLILAQNDVMLCAALSYFCDTYLNGEGGRKDVFWPSNLHYTAPTLSCEDDDYTILRAEQSGEGGVEAVSLLFETIHNKSGARPVRKTDFNYKSTEREILLGYPDHPLAKEILATLSNDDYYIGVRDQTVMILARNDLMLNKAVTHFISLFVASPHATVEKKAKKIELPAICDYYYHEQSITLAEDGVNHAVLVYPDRASALVRSAVESFCTLYKQLTNTTLTAYADSKYERVEGVFEILVGRTERRESQKLYFEGIEKGAWQIKMDEDAKALVLGANGEFALKAAVEALGTALRTQTAALSREDIYDGWRIKEGVDRLLYLPLDFMQDGAEAPDLIGAFSYKLYSYSYVMQQSNVIPTKHEEYCTVLERAGFLLAPQLGDETNGRSVYQSTTRTVSITYNEKAGTLYVQVSPRRER